MNLARYQSIHRGLSAVARKVFDAVPAMESWSKTQIHQELRRLNRTIEARIVEGCLNSLCESGIVVESPRGSFRRVQVIEKPAKVHEAGPAEQEQDEVMESMATNQIAPSSAPKTDALSKLAKVAEQVSKLQAQLKDVASQIETIAIEIDEQVTAKDVEYSKLKQLGNLLKELA
jgi:hypothetical protein